MQSKQFRQPTVREALRAIREELGRRRAGAVDRDGAGARLARLARRARGPGHGRRAERERRRRAVRPPPERRPRRHRSPAARRASSPACSRAVSTARLAEARSPRCRPVGRAPRRLARATCARALAAQLDGARPPATKPFARVEVFVGPPGVGKTTTIAKIAAQERARRGRPLGLVAADGFRAGAVEQLRIYANIIGAPFRVARTLEELDKALATQPPAAARRHRRPLAVRRRPARPAPTARQPPRRPHASRDGRRHQRRIGAPHPRRLQRRAARSPRDHQDRRSRVAVAAAQRRCTSGGIPVSYVTAGQRVPEDLDRATPLTLASAVLTDAPPVGRSRS